MEDDYETPQNFGWKAEGDSSSGARSSEGSLGSPLSATGTRTQVPSPRKKKKTPVSGEMSQAVGGEITRRAKKKRKRTPASRENSQLEVTDTGARKKKKKIPRGDSSQVVGGSGSQR
jgi:hypothetical protein